MSEIPRARIASGPIAAAALAGALLLAAPCPAAHAKPGDASRGAASLAPKAQSPRTAFAVVRYGDDDPFGGAVVAVFNATGRRVTWAKADPTGYVELTARPGTYTVRIVSDETAVEGTAAVPTTNGAMIDLPRTPKPLARHPVFRALAGARDLVIFVLGFAASSLPAWIRMRHRRLALLRPAIRDTGRLLSQLLDADQAPDRDEFLRELESLRDDIAPLGDSKALAVYQDTRLWEAATILLGAIGGFASHLQQHVHSTPEWRDQVQALRSSGNGPLRDREHGLRRARFSLVRLVYWL